jgi:hypothetical protein
MILLPSSERFGCVDSKRRELVRKQILAVIFIALCPLLAAQQALNNDSVIKLVKAGLSDDLIVSTINGSAGVYDTSADGIIALKKAAVSDRVVSAIVMKASATSQPAPAPLPAQSSIPAQAPAAAAPPPPFHSTDGKIRIYVTDHPMFESNGIAMASGNRHGGSAGAVEHVQAGDDPRTVEIQADIVKVCPANVIASNNQDRSDYVLVFRRRGGERSSMFAMGGLTGLALSAGAKVDGASLFENNGDMVYATKQTSVEKSIRDICLHIPGVAAPGAPSSLAPIPPPPPAN